MLSITNNNTNVDTYNLSPQYIHFSIVNSCVSFIHHIKEKYGLILKFTHGIIYSLSAFIHSIHNINFSIYQIRNKEKNGIFNMCTINRENDLCDEICKYIKFPLNFNKIINHKRDGFL